MTVGITELPPEGMQLGGVALAGDADRGTKTTEGLSLLFTTAGITVQGPQPQIERLLVWSGLDTATCREKIALADGRTAAVMELTSGGQSIRFLLPTETVTPGQAAYLDQALPAWLARYKGTPAPTAPAPAPSSSAPADTAPAPHDPGSFQPAATAAAAAAGAAAGSAFTAPVAAGATAPPPPPTAAASPAPPAPSVAPPPPPPSAATAPPPAVAPPPPPAPPGAPAPAVAPPPPATPAPWSGGAPGPTGSPGPAGWEPTAPAPPTPAAGWDDPPLGQVAAADVLPPPKKTRGWRKQADPPAPTEPAAAPGFLPPPPAGYGAPDGGATGAPAAWSLPVDPVTGQAAWGDPTAGGVVAPEEPTKKSRGWRKSSKAAAVAAGAATAGAAGAATAAPGDLLAPPGGQAGAPFGSPADPFATAPPGPPGEELPGSTGTPPAKKSRTTLLLVILLVVVVAAGAVYFVKKHNNSSTTPTVPPVTAPSGTAADIALAGSINLRLTDLPAGWTRSPTTTQATVPPVAPAAAETQALQSLASCLAQPVAVVDGLFGTGALTGQTAAVRSPTYQSVAATGIQMSSTTAVLGTAAEVTPLAAAFTNANFATCYGTFQSSVVAAAVPGATAQVQTVTLAAPAGVSSYGYLTTYTIPNQGTEVLGQAFMLGGRIVAKLTPTTNGPAVPSSAFNPAYTAMVGRVAQAASK